MSWLEIKYLERMRFQLENFEQVSNTPFVSNFKCPLCGDSKRRKNKKRAYVYEKNNTLSYYCHNCGASMSFFNFLQSQNSTLYAEYKLEWLKSMGRIVQSDNVAKLVDKFKTSVQFERLLKLGTRIDDCLDNDPVLQYVKKRKIPEHYWSSLYSCSNIRTITDQIPRYSNTKLEPEPALIIPFFNEKRQYSYISSRSIESGTSFRYLVLEIDDQLPKLWGLEKIDWTKKVYIFEGPIDAMCISNSLALAGSVGQGSIEYILKHINKPCDACFVYDNEFLSNKQINKQVQKRIKEGFSVVIYDKNFLEKDVNEVICNETMTLNDVNVYLEKRSFNGLNALLEIARLSKPHNR